MVRTGKQDRLPTYIILYFLFFFYFFFFSSSVDENIMNFVYLFLSFYVVYTYDKTLFFSCLAEKHSPDNRVKQILNVDALLGVWFGNPTKWIGAYQKNSIIIVNNLNRKFFHHFNL